MAMRAAARRLLADVTSRTRVGSSRGFSGGSGRVLSEEEKAAENIYIKKMEKERAEKAVRQGVNPETAVREASETSKASHTEAVKGDPDKKTKTIAVYAGIAGLIGLVYLLAKKEPRRQEKDRE